MNYILLHKLSKGIFHTTWHRARHMKLSVWTTACPWELVSEFFVLLCFCIAFAFPIKLSLTQSMGFCTFILLISSPKPMRSMRLSSALLLSGVKPQAEGVMAKESLGHIKVAWVENSLIFLLELLSIQQRECQLVQPVLFFLFFFFGNLHFLWNQSSFSFSCHSTKRLIILRQYTCETESMVHKVLF